MKKIIGAGLAFAPFLAFAVEEDFSDNLGGTISLLEQIGNIINILLPIILALATLYFFWGLAQFVLNSADPEKRKEGQAKMIWGVVAMAVMLSVFGLVNFLQGEFGLTNNDIENDDIPTIPVDER